MYTTYSTWNNTIRIPPYRYTYVLSSRLSSCLRFAFALTLSRSDRRDYYLQSLHVQVLSFASTYYHLHNPAADISPLSPTSFPKYILALSASLLEPVPFFFFFCWNVLSSSIETKVISSLLKSLLLSQYFTYPFFQWYISLLASLSVTNP